MDDDRAIARAAEIIRRGGLVAFPTETVYGLGANALDATAVARIYEVKGRPPESPIIVHVDSVAMARSLAAEWPAVAEALVTRWWPGPLTLVLRKRPEVPDIVTARLTTVGLRVPAHSMALALIRAAGVPIAAPSANRFGELSPVTAGHVRTALGDLVDCVLDGGTTEVGIESTVLSVAGATPALLRPGMVSREEIEAAIGPIVEGARFEGAHPSPGMHPRHYSPRTPLILGDPPRRGRGAYVWRSREAAAAQAIRLPADAAAYAARLYAALHELDARGFDWIAVEPPPETPEWAAIADRLRRAASG
jgi:L-threonylcarbamoyladenylate synthase